MASSWTIPRTERGSGKLSWSYSKIALAHATFDSLSDALGKLTDAAKKDKDDVITRAFMVEIGGLAALLYGTPPDEVTRDYNYVASKTLVAGEPGHREMVIGKAALELSQLHKSDARTAATKLGEVTNAPFSLVWSNVLPGAYTLYAIAADDRGLIAKSAGSRVLIGSGGASNLVLLPAGSEWRYLDTGVDPGVEWRQPDFDDALWNTGFAQFGYGDGDEVTRVGFGPDSNNKFITTYFRTKFVVGDTSAIPTLVLKLLRDDGEVTDLEVRRASLEDTYMAMVQRHEAGEGDRVHQQLVDDHRRAVERCDGERDRDDGGRRHHDEVDRLGKALFELEQLPAALPPEVDVRAEHEERAVYIVEGSIDLRQDPRTTPPGSLLF